MRRTLVAAGLTAALTLGAAVPAAAVDTGTAQKAWWNNYLNATRVPVVMLGNAKLKQRWLTNCQAVVAIVWAGSDDPYVCSI